ncbi:MAG: hypothetical protein LBR29_11725, partial [Methylobacteriaceae bacterium]|nr:hypothetical protein [Methylobacteriaceae bacterium]
QGDFNRIANAGENGFCSIPARFDGAGDSADDAGKREAGVAPVRGGFACSQLNVPGRGENARLPGPSFRR